MLEGEGSCAQPQASKPAETLAQTTPQGGRGPPAGSSQAGGGSVERRRSSVVVVALGQHHEKKGAAAVVVEQARLTLMALGLALMMAPVAATIEPLVELLTKALPNFEPTAPCQGLLTDRRGVDLVILAALGFLMVQTGLQIASLEANPRASRLLLHTMLVGVGASVACPAWYASAVASLSPLQVIAYGFLTAFVVCFSPFVSFAAWGVATAKRRSCKRAAQGIVYSVILSATAVTIGFVTDCYVTLSDQVSGSAGVVINGILYPVAQYGVRRVLQRLLRGRVSSGSLDYAGVLVLLLEIVTSAPQFYVLTRIDGTPQFIVSAFSSFASEWIGAVVAARAAHVELDLNTGREWLSRVKSSRVLSSRVQPSELPENVLGPGSGDDAPAALKHGASSIASRSEAVMRNKLLLATKVAHEELGEKVAVFLGCTVALWVGGLSSESVAKALALVLLEAVSDLAKAAAYAASEIDVGHVRFNFHWPTLLGLALVGGGSWAALLVAVRINCLIGEDVGSVLG